MRPIHPDYVEAKVSCGCGNTFVTRATVPELHVEICSVCHPFYTGQQKIIDSAGMVERFQKKWTSSQAQKKATDHAERRRASDPRGRAAERAEKVLKGEVKLSDLEKHFPKPKKNLPPEPPLPNYKKQQPPKPAPAEPAK
jgi:large subunit ribosomal protein L31